MVAEYQAWVWRTLMSRVDGLEEHQRLACFQNLADALASGKTTIFGAQIPSSAMPAVRALGPRIADEIHALRERGVEVVREEKVPLWAVRSRREAASLHRRLQDLPGTEDSLGPYRRVANAAVGGLRAAGFAPSSDFTLVLSSSGRGVFDGRTGERVGRNREVVTHSDYPARVMGIAPIEGQRVSMMGLDGGLPLSTSGADGWTMGVMPQAGGVWLCPRGMPTDEPGPGAFVLRQKIEDARAAGFSASGRALLIADAQTLHLFALEDEKT